MRPSLLNRRVHYWLSAVIAFPILVVLLSGLLLQVKKQFDWVQPPEQRGTVSVPQIDLRGILDSVRADPSLGVESWEDVNRIDVRPAKGLAKVQLHNGYEVQVDLGTGERLQAAYRRSDWIEALHDGSFFAGDWTKLGLFLPSAVSLLALWCTGMWMFWQPLQVRWRRRRRVRFAAREVELPAGDRSGSHPLVAKPGSSSRGSLR